MRPKRASPDNGKIIRVNPNVDEGNDHLYTLTTRQAGLLLQLTEYLMWKNRYKDFPDEMNTDDKLDAYISDLRLRLMMEIDYCEKVRNCISTDTGTRDLIRDITNHQNPTDGSPNGQPISEDDFNRDLVAGSNPSCSTVILSRQCSAFVRLVNGNITDFLQNFEVATNSLELLNALSNIPVAHEILELIGEEEFANYLAYLQDSIAEEYDAQQSDEYMDDLARLLFCKCVEDCQVTIAHAFDFTADLMNTYIDHATSDAMETLTEVFELVTGSDVTGHFVVDSFYWTSMGMAKLGNFLFFGFIDRMVSFKLKSAANDASFDLDLTGVECFTEWVHVLTSDDNDLLFSSNITIDSDGIITPQLRFTDPGGDFWGFLGQWLLPVSTTVTYMKIEYTGLSGTDGFEIGNHFATFRDMFSANISDSGFEIPIIEGDRLTENTNTYGGVRQVIAQYDIRNSSVLFNMKITLHGTGVNPFV